MRRRGGVEGGREGGRKEEGRKGDGGEGLRVEGENCIRRILIDYLLGFSFFFCGFLGWGREVGK